MSASAITATVTDAGVFDCERDFATWLAMTPRQYSSGGNEKLGRVSKRGDGDIGCAARLFAVRESIGEVRLTASG
jgi:transposase